jgi:hypothetical protein
LGGSREDQVGTLLVSFGFSSTPCWRRYFAPLPPVCRDAPALCTKERRISSFVEPLHATSDAHAEKPTNNRWRCALQREGARKRDPKPHLGPFVGGSHFTRMHGCGVMFNLEQTTALGGAHRHLIQTLGPASCHPNHSPQPKCMLSENDPNLLELYIRANAPRSLSF